MHTLCQELLAGKVHTLQYNVDNMRKDTALSFRVQRGLKTDLEKVALNEGRSLSQVCEALLAGGWTFTRRKVLNTSSGCSPTRKGMPRISPAGAGNVRSDTEEPSQCKGSPKNAAQYHPGATLTNPEAKLRSLLRISASN